MQSFSEVWSGVCSYCSKLISNTAMNTWINSIEPMELKNDEAILFVRSDFQRQIIMSRYLDYLKDGFKETLGFPVKITILTEEDKPDAVSKPGQPSSKDIEQTYADAEYEYTFDTFIVGSSNKFAHAASLAVASNPAKAYNPLFIYGGSGLGKTHLLHAIQHEIKKNHPEMNIVYIKGEDFTNELVESIRQNNQMQFRNKYRQSSVLLVDDIQFVAGKESTQEEFFHTFNSLYEAHKQIVLTSDRPPKEIQTLEDRLRTRFEWGLLADVQPPDFETRLAIIKRKAELLGIKLPDEVSEFIANRLKNNIRQLEGAVKKIKAYNLLNGLAPSVATAQEAIKDILNDNQPVPVTVQRIIDEVARTYNVSPADIRGKMRSGNISSARQIAMYIVREITQLSTTNIGDEFGHRDHATVVYAIQKVEKDMKSNARLKATIEDIIKNIQAS
ncbi:chromosomal replication initiator protein DnaA [[Clostridium] cellulosi]